MRAWANEDMSIVARVLAVHDGVDGGGGGFTRSVHEGAWVNADMSSKGCSLCLRQS